MARRQYSRADGSHTGSGMSLAALRTCELSLFLSFVLRPYRLLCHSPQHQRNASISLFSFPVYYRCNKQIVTEVKHLESLCKKQTVIFRRKKKKTSQGGREAEVCPSRAFHKQAPICHQVRVCSHFPGMLGEILLLTNCNLEFVCSVQEQHTDL